MGLDGFGISEEVFDRNAFVFFYLVNPTYMKDEDATEAREFRELYSDVITNRPNITNVGKFLKYEAIKILWDGSGTEDFKGFSISDELQNIFETLIHDGDQDMPYSDKDMETVKNHMIRIIKDNDLDYNFVPMLVVEIWEDSRIF